MKKRLAAVTAAILLASLSATPAMALASPRDALSGTWRRIENFNNLPSTRKIDEMCNQRHRPALLKEGGKEALRVAENFVQIMPHDHVYLEFDHVYISSEYKHFGIDGRRQIKEIRESNFGVRKFVAKRTGVFFYVFDNNSMNTRTAKMRVVAPKKDPEYFVKCP
ncbi:MAG: hypothetical protein KTR21_03550 [Rhodobacteraceae bacterium]|nr:hypothetical protein [Paracoccaceae bacterium]